MARKQKYQEDELVRLLLLTNGLGELPQTVATEGSDRLNTDAKMRLRKWYASLLATAPADEVNTEDLKSEIREAWYTSSGAMCVRLPERGVRLVEVRLPEWDRGVRAFARPGDAAALNQLNAELRATPARPVVILGEEVITIYGLNDLSAAAEVTAGSRITQAPSVGADPGARFKSLRMTAQPADGSYVFDLRHWPGGEFF